MAERTSFLPHEVDPRYPFPIVEHAGKVTYGARELERAGLATASQGEDQLTPVSERDLASTLMNVKWDRTITIAAYLIKKYPHFL